MLYRARFVRIKPKALVEGVVGFYGVTIDNFALLKDHQTRKQKTKKKKRTKIAEIAAKMDFKNF